MEHFTFELSLDVFGGLVFYFLLFDDDTGLAVDEKGFVALLEDEFGDCPERRGSFLGLVGTDAGQGGDAGLGEHVVSAEGELLHLTEGLVLIRIKV